MKTRLRGLVLAAVTALLVATVVTEPSPLGAQGIGAPPGPAHTDPPSMQPVSAAEARAWRADLDQLARELVHRHADAFHTVTPDAFQGLVSALRPRLGQMSRHEIVVELQRIVASIGDGHTSIPLLFDRSAGFHALPLRLGWYEEGIYVEAGDATLEPAVGGRVVAVGGIGIDEAVARLTPLVSRDNDIWLRVMVPLYLTVTEILHAIGLSEDPMAAMLRIERDGDVRTVRVRAGAEPFVLDHGAPAHGPEGWIDARDTSTGDPPLHLRQPGRAYWRELLPEHRTLYIRYNQVNDAPHGPGVEAFFEESLRFADERGVERLVLDIRNNSGGEGMLNYGVVREILRRPHLAREGGLFVIIGRRTFSAAQVLAHMLDLWTEAVFIGEPTGSGPQFYGDHAFFRLDNSGLLVSASPTWWQPGGPYDRRPFLPPRLAFEPRWADYLAGRDPALEAILAWDDGVTLEEEVLGILGSSPAGGERDPAIRQTAAEAVRRWSSDPIHRYARATAELNRAGYRLLRDGRSEEALAVFRLNVEVHPEYANGWDSLGEALLSMGRREEGLAAYRRAYELDPGVGRAAEVLGREPPSDHGDPPEGR